MDETLASSEQLWVKRPYQDSDRDFVIYTWLAANRYSPDALSMNAHKDKEAQKRYWLGAERLVCRLVDKCEVTVAEAESDGSKIIVGWICFEDDCIVHYTLTRRKFMRLGVATDLLEPFTAHGKRVLYSHKPAVRGLAIPENWQYDLYTALKWMK